jgi:hypothetical protein
MEPEDARLQDVRAWLAKAKLDLRAAAHEASAPAEGLWGDVMFHAQQAAEKSLKAFLAWHDVPFRKTHNLEDIGQLCVALDATLCNHSPSKRRHSLNMLGSFATPVKRMNPSARRLNLRWRRSGIPTKLS